MGTPTRPQCRYRYSNRRSGVARIERRPKCHGLGRKVRLYRAHRACNIARQKLKGKPTRGVSRPTRARYDKCK